VDTQTQATFALAFFAAVQGVGVWFRMAVAYKQYKLEKEKFEYRKERSGIGIASK
jgi:hypothetical protein